MRVIDSRNVAQAMLAASGLMTGNAVVKRDSRNGPVTMFKEPVTTVLRRPTERVVFFPERDANPFFHFFEGLWMLAGRRDVKSVASYADNMKTYSDDGRNFHAAYGFRWRQHFDMDQLPVIAQRLAANPDDRRCVMAMWDPRADLGKEGKDFPCNTHIYFAVSPDGALDMTVCNRSNDLVFGAYGANAVHMSMMMEFMAGAVGVPVGVMRTMSNNLHLYDSNRHLFDPLWERLPKDEPYHRGEVEPYPMIQTPPNEWLQDLLMMLDEGVVVGLRDPFFRRVAVPILKAHKHFKTTKGEDRYLGALEILQQCAASDWRRACEEWIIRREQKWRKAADGTVHAAGE